MLSLKNRCMPQILVDVESVFGVLTLCFLVRSERNY